MQLREALHQGLKVLLAGDVPSPDLAAELLLMYVLGRDRAYLYTYPEADLSEAATRRYFELIGERSTGRPTQYITGHQEFWGLDFEVTPDVLIPRPETEHVVEAVLQLADTGSAARSSLSIENRKSTIVNSKMRIVDVGTGSGCIALALASELPGARIFATDISPATLVVARRNAARLGMAHRVEFLAGDLLTPLLEERLGGTFDFVVSNPPYVGIAELDSVQREVREFEPRVAWGGVEDGGAIYRRLFRQALEALKPGGHLVVEIGYTMRDKVLALLADGWTEREARPDLSGIPRVVLARKRP
jgi:release factor glutamine methyltransferase